MDARNLLYVAIGWMVAVPLIIPIFGNRIARFLSGNATISQGAVSPDMDELLDASCMYLSLTIAIPPVVTALVWSADIAAIPSLIVGYGAALIQGLTGVGTTAVYAAWPDADTPARPTRAMASRIRRVRRPAIMVAATSPFAAWVLFLTLLSARRTPAPTIEGALVGVLAGFGVFASTLGVMWCVQYVQVLRHGRDDDLTM